MTPYYKFPVHRGWLVLVSIFAIAQISVIVSTSGISPMILVILAGSLMIGTLGFAMMKAIPRDFVDEVIDEGNALLIRNAGTELRVALSGIQEVNFMGYERPQRLSIVLRDASPLGKTITFIPRYIPLCFASHPIASDLRQRVEAIHTSDR